MDSGKQTERIIVPTIDFIEGNVEIIDQTLLPGEEKILKLERLDQLAEAIRSLRVRGAPAIGIAAAYGVLLEIENALKDEGVDPAPYYFDRREGAHALTLGDVDIGAVRKRFDAAREVIAQTRPTAANLFWALDRMASLLEGAGDDAGALCRRLAGEAFRIHEEELEIEIAIGENGSRFIEDGMNVLTHCNAGGLAAAGYGTALGVIYRAYEEGKRFHVYAGETRPLLQGARLTAWELEKRGIEATLLCDSAAASLFSAGSIDAVIVGADRIAANGDTANKIGTLGLALLCDSFGKPFYVAAPWSTFDITVESGGDIPIEERAAEEVTCFAGSRTAPEEIDVYNPAFDVTPARLITAIITENGVIERPDREGIRRAAEGR